MSDDYQQRAQQHRPTSMEALAAEVRRLHRDGLSVRDIAVALQLNDADVADMLKSERSSS